MRTTGYTNISTEPVVKDVAQFFKVLADDARLQMLWLLFNHEELCVCDIMAALGITQSKASRHLATLRHAGLVVDRKEAAWSYYSIRPVEGALERTLLDALRAKLADHPDAARILGSLHARMAGSDRSVACSAGAACTSARKARKPSPKRRPLRRHG